MSVTRQLAEFLAATRFDDLPSQAVVVAEVAEDAELQVEIELPRAVMAAGPVVAEHAQVAPATPCPTSVCAPFCASANRRNFSCQDSLTAAKMLRVATTLLTRQSDADM